VSPNVVDPRLTAPYRLYFWSNENIDTHKPAHVHVDSSDGFAEFWLAPVRVRIQARTMTSSGLGPDGSSSSSSQSAWKPGSSCMAAVEPVAGVDPRARAARVRGTTLIVSLVDGREVRVPIRWFPRLLAGSADARANLRITEGGRALNWPDLDEDIGVEPLLATAGATGSR